ncbi:MAG: hypothetical protein COX44_01830 [Candidatus Portnoybacteria bacterium CG23_combo_of_CG06-09_8_20_14_all_37_13]|uniref:TGS domain-containing protein n=1 Tax=Candidatus Portnoybacteria bacterium CG23_combo_of_CG06-09_8_20_14_all_37_13 TaxID=1974819 RepID=A0A2G9YEX4_9BACT|nr:MAG: hypothetical protein COX44_01830 [Candidatus Portnoybacteria bacterium CG23_combo_of_CG06-09_8_20_14_all_37_13]
MTLVKDFLKLSQQDIDEIINNCYNLLSLITFYTIKGNKEIRAFAIRKETNIIEAAAKLHSDFAEKFIRAEVVNANELIKAGSWQKARAQGKIKTEGKKYLVQNNDVIEFKI